MTDYYILNKNYEPDVIIENYKSMIWKEVFNGAGDFELVLSYQSMNSLGIKLGTVLGQSDSSAIMIVDYIEVYDDEEGSKTYIVKGYSGEYLLEYAPARFQNVPKYYFYTGDVNQRSEETQTGRKNFFVNTLFNATRGNHPHLDEQMPLAIDMNTDTTSATGSDGILKVKGYTSDRNTWITFFGGNQYFPWQPGHFYCFSVKYKITQDLTDAIAGTGFYFMNNSNNPSAQIYVPLNGTNQNTEGVINFWWQQTTSVGRIIFYLRTAKDKGAIEFSDIYLDESLSMDTIRERSKKGYFNGYSNYFQLNPKEKMWGSSWGMADTFLKRYTDSSPELYNKFEIIKDFKFGIPPTLNGYIDGPNPAYEDFMEELEFSYGEDSAYSVITNYCKQVGMGFLVRRYNGKLWIKAHYGTDRSLGSIYNTKNFVYSRDLGNVISSKRISNNRDYRNLASVYGKNSARYTDGRKIITDLSPYPSMRVISIKDDTITAEQSSNADDQKFIQKGRDALSEALPSEIVDGEFKKQIDLVYEKDFGLGSVVSCDFDGYGEWKGLQISEYTFVSDDSGQKQYPTLIKYVNDGRIYPM